MKIAHFQTCLLFTLLFSIQPLKTNAQYDSLLERTAKSDFDRKMMILDSLMLIPEMSIGPYLEATKANKEIFRLNALREKYFPDGSIEGEVNADSIFMSQNLLFKTTSQCYGDWKSAGPVGDPFMGPPGTPSGFSNYHRNGRLDCIAFKHNDPNTLYVGSGNGGGLWKVNGTTGVAESMNTDKLTLHNGVGSVATAPGRVVIATGHSYKGIIWYGEWETACRGIFYSDDEGQTWNKATVTDKNANDPFTYSSGNLNWVSKIAVNPLDPDMMYLTTFNIRVVEMGKPEDSYGALFKSVDGGETWTEVDDPVLDNRFFQDVEFHPINPDIIYLSSQKVYKTTNGGNTWTDVTSFLQNIPARTPATPTNSEEQQLWQNHRIWLTVPAKGCSSGDGDHVVVLVRANEGTPQIYHSTDALASNLVANGLSTTEANKVRWGLPWHGGISMTHDPQVLYMGWQIIQTSENGGTSFATSHLYGHATHPDIQEIGIPPFDGSNAGVAFATTDGGLWRTSDFGKTFVALNDGLVVNQFYSLGVSQTDNSLLAGTQDNANIRRLNNSVWQAVGSGDGAYASPVNPNDPELYAWSDFSNTPTFVRYLSRTGSVITTNILHTTGWGRKKFLYQHNEPNTLLCVSDRLYRVPNNSSPIIGNPFPGMPNNFSTAFDYCFSDPEILYAATRGQVNIDHTDLNLFKSTDGGINWTSVSPQLVGVQGEITSVKVHPYDPDKVWITFGGFETKNWQNQNVFYSSNGGLTWQNYSDGLPKGSTKEIIYQLGTDDKLFVAMDRGIWYRTAQMSQWECFSTGLPNTHITDLEINYCDGKLYAATFGRGVWFTDLFPNAEVPDWENEVITNNTTWSESRTIFTGIRITNNSVLTIESSNTIIRMPTQGAITIEPGSKLIIDGATITNGCDNCFWNGINVKGNPDLVQTPANQGVLEIKNDALIEHARRGIRNYYQGDFHSGGGIVLASNSTFRNNRKSIEFITYQNTNHLGAKIGDKSKFINCSFEINDQYKGNAINYPFDCHASLWQVDGVRFEGCSFTNHGIGISKDVGSGIYTYRAGYQVVPYCPNPYGNYPCSGITRSYFEGFRTGIHAADALTDDLRAVNVEAADFVNNSIGVYVEGGVNISVTRSDFQLGDGKPIGNSCYDNIGINTAGVRQFTIQENSFNANSGQSNINIGVYTSNSVLGNGSGQTNTIYKNNFENLTKACWAANRNRTSFPQFGSPLLPAGLFYECNTFYNNEKAIFITASGISGATGQGILGGRGNIFDQNIVDIENQGSHFYYSHNGGSTQPQILGDITLTSGAAVNCGSGLSSFGVVFDDPELFGELLSDLPDLRLRLANGLDYLSGAIDAGDIEALYDDFMSQTNHVQFLEDHSPYLSGSFLRMVAQEQVLGEGELRSILISNPDALRVPGYLESLLADHLIDQTQLEYIKEAIAGVTTELTDSIQSVTYANLDLAVAYRKLVTHIKNDSLHQYRDSIITWLNQTDGLAAGYDLIGAWFGNKQYANAISVLAELPGVYSMTAADSVEYLAFKTIFDVQYALDTSGRHHTELTDLERSTLVDVSQNNPASWIEDIAHTNTNPHTPAANCYWVYESLRKTKELAENEKPEGETSQVGNVIVYPNPASHQVTFRYGPVPEAKDLKLSITSSTGVTIFQAHLPYQQGEMSWNTRSIPPGYYIYHIVDGKRKVATGRVVIVK